MAIPGWLPSCHDDAMMTPTAVEQPKQLACDVKHISFRFLYHSFFPSACIHKQPARRRPTSVEQGDVDGQFILSFETTVSDLLGSEAQQLAHMTSFPEVATDMTVSEAFIISRLRQDPGGSNKQGLVPT